MRMMMVANKMMKVTMLQRENTDTWASYRQYRTGVTTDRCGGGTLQM